MTNNTISTNQFSNKYALLFILGQLISLTIYIYGSYKVISNYEYLHSSLLTLFTAALGFTCAVLLRKTTKVKEVKSQISNLVIVFWGVLTVISSLYLILSYTDEHPIQYVLIGSTLLITFRGYFLLIKMKSEEKSNELEQTIFKTADKLLQQVKKDAPINEYTMHEFLLATYDIIELERLNNRCTVWEQIQLFKAKYSSQQPTLNISKENTLAIIKEALKTIFLTKTVSVNKRSKAFNESLTELENLIKTIFKEDNCEKDLLVKQTDAIALYSYEVQLTTKQQKIKGSDCKRYNPFKILLPIVLFISIGVTIISIKQLNNIELLYTQFFPYTILSYCAWIYLWLERKSLLSEENSN